MGELIVTEMVTLDGVAQAPSAPDEDRDSGFVHGGWQAPLFDEQGGDAMFEQAQRMDALLLGSGKRVFGDGTVPSALRLTESVTHTNGTLQLVYETVGAPAYGNLAI